VAYLKGKEISLKDGYMFETGCFLEELLTVEPIDLEMVLEYSMASMVAVLGSVREASESVTEALSFGQKG
jgi:hypothetical protein